jgi:hypothetical protein
MAMECETMLNDKYQLWDIKDGTGITEIAALTENLSWMGLGGVTSG